MRILLTALLWMLVAGTVLAQDPTPATTGPTIPPGEYILGGVTVKGAAQTDEQSVLLLSGLAVGRKIEIPGETLSNALGKLWKQELFSDVRIDLERIEGKRLFVVITVQERPRVTRYVLRGVRSGQEKELREKIKLVTGTIFTEAKSRSAVRIIKNFFQEKGYLNTDVQVELKADTMFRRNGVMVTLNVKKGPKVKIKRIVVDGNTAFSDKKIKKKLKDTKEAKFYRFWKRSKYLRGAFNEDKALVLEAYRDKGYRDFEILSDTMIQLSPRRVEVRMKINEGKPYYFRNITWSGNFKYKDDILARILNIKRGDVFSQATLDKNLSGNPLQGDVSSLYLDDGYLFFRATPVEVAVDGDSIDIEIRIQEGSQATIRKVIITGTEKTSDHVVRREVRTLPGEKFSRADLIRTQREILALGYFDQQKMDITPIPDPQRGTVDIKYGLEEKSSDQITLQGGWTGQTRDQQGNVLYGGLLATVSLQLNNFSTRKVFTRGAWKPYPAGDGQKVTLTVQTNGVNFQNYGISFLDPWFGGRKPNSFGVSTNYSIQSIPLYDYRIGIYNLQVDLGRRLKWPDDFFRSFSSIRYANYNLKNAFNVFSNFGNGTGDVNILSFRQTFDRTSIDAPIYSRSGSVFTLNLEATPPYSLFQKGRNYGAEPAQDKFRLLEFWKIKWDSQFFLTLAGNKLPTVLYLRARYGFLGAYNPQIGVSPFERFYLGGDGLVGFQIDGREIFGMRGYQTPNIGPASGAVAYAKYTMELRQPITLEQSANVWVHAFVEAGNAWGSLDQFNPFTVRRSAGVGLRAFLPMFGLLGIDYGYGFDNVQFQGSNIGGGRFHFVIGQQF